MIKCDVCGKPSVLTVCFAGLERWYCLECAEQLVREFKVKLAQLTKQIRKLKQPVIE